MATVQRYCNTGSTAGGDGTTNGTAGATRAYASQSEAEANMGGSATDDYILDCAGTAADTTAVTWHFATRITTGSILIRGNRSDGAGFYSGNNAISTAHYRMAPASGTVLIPEEENITFDGIQILTAGGAFFGGIDISAAMQLTVKKCRLRASSATDYGIGSGGATVSGSSKAKIFENNLLVGFNVTGLEFRTPAFWSPVITVRNNTIYGDGSSIGIQVADTASASAVYSFKGNAIGNTGASNAFSVSLAGGSVTYADNATEDAQGTTDEIAIGTLANAWTSPGTSNTAVFGVKNSGSSLYQAVNPTLVTDDITDATRTGSNHDVGAFMFVAAALSGANFMMMGAG